MAFKDPEKKKAYDKAWDKAHRQTTEYYRRRYEAQKANHPKSYFKNRNLRQYGITLEDFEQILLKQHGVCAVCLNPETATDQNGQIKMLAVDHNHKTGKVRGLLCNNCNRAIGLLKDNKKVLLAALLYLEKHG